MKAFAFSHKGFVDVCAQELTENGAKILEQDNIAVKFEAEPEIICKLIYCCQSVTKFLIEGINAKVNSLEDITTLAKQINENELIIGKKTFRVTALSDSFSSKEVMESIGEIIMKKTGLKVDLKNPDVTFLMIVSCGKAYIGIDIVPFDISKRSYKIFHSAMSMKGTLAYCLVRWSGYSGKGILLDPCAGVGVIPIEAALFASKKSPHFFKKRGFRLDEFEPFKKVNEELIYVAQDKNIKSGEDIYCFDKLLALAKSAQKNAKIAGVEKLITTTKGDVEWLDTKLKEKEISFLVTQPPVFSHEPETEKKFYKMFFYQADYILTNDGVVVLLCNDVPLQEAADHHFKLEEERIVYSGKQAWKAAKFKHH